MSEAKCPLCNGDLIQSEAFPYFYSCQSTNWKSIADKRCELDDCAASVPVWEALRRTRKALDVAVDALKLLNSEGKRTRILGLISITDTALKQITALEQKDVK